MIAFDTSGLNAAQLSGAPPVVLAGFIPSVTFTDTWNGNFVFTDASTFVSPDTFGKINIIISDQSGKTITGSITSASGTVTISTATLSATDNYIVKAVVMSTAGCIADGEVKVLTNATSGALANWSISFTTTAFNTSAL